MYNIRIMAFYHKKRPSLLLIALITIRFLSIKDINGLIRISYFDKDINSTGFGGDTGNSTK